MRKILGIIFLGIFLFCCASIHKRDPNNCMKHKEDNLLLSKIEGAYLNEIFETARKDFDFANKKVGFYTGSSGGTKSSKKHYLDMQEKHSVDENYPCDNGTLYIFNAEQKRDSGGYDAAILYWSKVLLPVQQMIKQLNGQQ